MSTTTKTSALHLLLLFAVPFIMQPSVLLLTRSYLADVEFARFDTESDSEYLHPLSLKNGLPFWPRAASAAARVRTGASAGASAGAHAQAKLEAESGSTSETESGDTGRGRGRGHRGHSHHGRGHSVRSYAAMAGST